MTKEQVIKAAYGELYEELKQFINEDGWTQKKSLINYSPKEWDSKNMKESYSNYQFKYRPKSLQGLENNRGWTRIESEEDLPKDRSKEDLLIVTETGEILVASSKYLSDAEIRKYWIKTVSHWQKFVKPKSPIF